MGHTLKILKYSFFDILRSRWTFIYFLFFLLSGFGLLYFSSNLNSGISSLMNVVLAIIPLISTVFGAMYYYNSREFAIMLLSQPMKRKTIFIGQLIGLSVSLALSFGVGIIIPFAAYGLFNSGEIWNFGILVVVGILLSFIFVSLSFLIATLNEDKIKGFGIAILVWLYLAVIYDGMFLLILLRFSDYPLEQTAISLSVLNPVDLSRILVLLKLDISALMGYTGAVFSKFFGTSRGMIVSFAALLLWIIIPVWLFLRFSRRKDF